MDMPAYIRRADPTPGKGEVAYVSRQQRRYKQTRNKSGQKRMKQTCVSCWCSRPNGRVRPSHEDMNGVWKRAIEELRHLFG